MWIRRSIIMLMIFAQVGFASYVEAGDEEYHLKILFGIKKINANLMEKIKAQMISMQKVQENIRQDINSIKGNLPQLQDVMERSAAETMSEIDGFESKLRDMESKVDDEVVAELKSQRQAGKHLQTELKDQFGQLKNELATDMVNLSKDNKQYFMDFNEGNKEKLQQIVQALGDQTEKLKKTQAVFKSDLIPALNTQSEEIRKALLAELAQARIEQKNSMESNHKQVVASLVTMDEKNKNLIEILKKSILVDEETKNLTAAIQLNIEGTNKNIDQTRKTIGMLQEVLISRLKSMTQEKAASEIRLNKNLDEIKKNQKSAEPRLVTLVDASRKIFEQSSQIQTDLKQSLETITSNQAQVDMANKKLAKLIEILKAIALEQGKIDQVLQGQGKLDQILQAQGKIDQVLQGQGKIKSLVNKGGVDDVLKGQGKMQSYLSDLRNKANVNISRNNDILKKMKSKK